MKPILLVVIALLATFCSPNKGAEIDTGHTEKSKLEILLDSVISASPGFLDNDIKRSLFGEALQQSLERYRGDTMPILEGVPFKFEMMIGYPAKGKEAGISKYAVKFILGEDATEPSDNYKVSLQVISVLPKKKALTLKEGAEYILNGTFIDFANCQGSFTLPSGDCFEDMPRVLALSKGVSSDYSYPYINLGTIVLDSMIFTPYEN